MKISNIKKLAIRLLDLSMPAWIAVCIVYGFILCTLRNGISCDEGYYLMGYLRNQSNTYLGTDFHNIVRALGTHFQDNDIMVFRYMRLFLFGCAIVLFSYASYLWLNQKFERKTSYFEFAPFVFLGGAWCYTFAAPTISYDHLQTIFYLFAFSFFFLMIRCPNKIGRIAPSSALGFFIWLSFANSAPSGACLMAFLLIWYISEYKTVHLIDLAGILLGVTASLTVYHFYIHNLNQFFLQIENSFIEVFTQKSMSRHDANGLMMSIWRALLSIIEYGIPTLIVSWIINKRLKVPNLIQYLITGLVILFLLIFSKFYRIEGLAIIIPLAWLLGLVISSKQHRTKITSWQFIIQWILLIAIPIMGGFGSNQPLLHKSVMFAPFWIVAFFAITHITSIRVPKLRLILTVLLMAGYIYLGNFSRYHYCYTPRSSTQPIQGAIRPQKVLISSYEQDYYHDIIALLLSETGKTNISFIGFGEHQIAGYLSGGLFDGDLVYHWWQYKFHGEKRPDCFLLFKREEKDVIEFFSKLPWEFPQKYQRIEMRAMAQNMTEDGLQTIIYIAK